ncbi:MAG: hypothetical protein ACFFCW_28675 [Candidatus Hodarchaeota archaeon]
MTDSSLLQQLSEKIGSERWWQLICTNANLNTLAHLLHYFDSPFKQKLIKYSEHLPFEDWQELLLRGNFKDLCNFIRWQSHLFSSQFPPAFLGSLKSTFETLIRRDNWEILNHGLELLAAASDSPIRQTLIALLNDYLATIDISSLHFDSFDEAVACVRLLWKQLSIHRQELSNSLLNILPSEENWHSNKNFLQSARLLFFILANAQAKQAYARRVLNIGNNLKVVVLINEATALDIFLYLWNLYNLWFQWEKKREKNFADFLHPEIQNTIANVLTKIVQTETNQEEIDNQISLLGFISWINLPSNKSIKSEFKAKLLKFEELIKRVSSKTFIPGVFFLFGLEWLFDKKIYPYLWKRLLPKVDNYSEKHAALEHLCELVRDRAIDSKANHRKQK